MIEVFVDFDKAIYEEVDKEIKLLLANGWSKFGSNGSMLLFKEGSLEDIELEFKDLGIKKLEPEETDYSVF